MKRTSAAVISLLLSTSCAVKISKAPGYDSVSDEAEKVHVLDIGQQPLSNDQTWAFPGVRTAFYAQKEGPRFYDQQNGLWRSLSQGEYDV